MYSEIDRIVHEAEKILDEKSRYDYLYAELEKLFGKQEFVFGHIRCGFEDDCQVYVITVSWVNFSNEPEQALYRILVKHEE